MKDFNIDKAIKVMMAVGTVVSGICAILSQLKKINETNYYPTKKINDCNGEFRPYFPHPRKCRRKKV